METETPTTLCYKLVHTYDTSVLDNKNITKELRDAFEKEAAINACGSNSVLMKLIKNHFTKTVGDRKTQPQFISGPRNLTVHWHPKYDKLIYLFGEYHITTNTCTTDFPESFGLNNPDKSSIDEFLLNLSQKNRCFY